MQPVALGDKIYQLQSKTNPTQISPCFFYLNLINTGWLDVLDGLWNIIGIIATNT